MQVYTNTNINQKQTEQTITVFDYFYDCLYKGPTYTTLSYTDSAPAFLLYFWSDDFQFHKGVEISSQLIFRSNTHRKKLKTSKK